jgi:uncharacterized protein (DUF58 family)
VKWAFKARLLPFVVAGLVILEIAFPHRTWVTLLLGLGGVWLVAWVWARALGRGLSLARERRFGLSQVGDQLEERFTVTNESWLPALWFEVLDDSTLPGYAVSRAMGVDGGSRLQWTTEGICQRRGAYRLGPTRLRSGDPFGIYTVEIAYPASTPVFVMPPVLPLPLVDVAPGGRVGEGRPQPRALERTVSASTVRPYVSGDPLRSIHWPTSARQDALYVRLPENTPAGDWWIYLDLNRAVQIGEGAQSTEEHAILLAASLAHRGLAQGHGVGLVTHGETLARLTPRAGEGQRLALMRALALAQPGSLSLGDLLARARPSLRELASLIVITPDVSGPWIEALLPLVWRGAVPTVFLIDPATYGSAPAPRAALATLARLQIRHFLITRPMLDRPEAHPGQRGLHWLVSPSGRAILTTQVEELEWKLF